MDVKQVDSVVVRFAGDSGDGIQLTGAQFAETAALAGNDFAIFPDYPSEIRAPARTIAGVSGYQIHFGSERVLTAGDSIDVLVVMNPAALKVNVGDLRPGGVVIVNAGAFDKRSLEKAGYVESPLADGSLSGFRVVAVDVTAHTLQAVKDLGGSRKDAERAKNFYALGLVYWLFGKSLEHTLAWIQQRFEAKQPLIAATNQRALQAGYAFAETSELFEHSYVVPPARLAPGHYVNLSGNEAMALGLAAAAERSGLALFLGTYPITPASEIFQYLAARREIGVTIFQAEDEIAAICACIGAAYAGALPVTTTSGPGLDLKAEALGLAVTLELPLVIVDVQRAGPSTGMPTKTEQSDLLEALFGRHGEAPIPVLAASSPEDCFWTAIEAARIALRSMTPVMVLSDGVLANGAEPFRIPSIAALPPLVTKLHHGNGQPFQPYLRDADLARPWAAAGTPGLEHRIGGLEKEHLLGRVSYSGVNHERMCQLRADKVRLIADTYPATVVHGADSGDLLIVSWGSTYGSVRRGLEQAPAGARIGHVHLRHLNPLPNDLGAIIRRFRRVLVPEMNSGQLSLLLRARYLVDAQSATKLQGTPFKAAEIASAVVSQLEVRA